MKNIFCIALLFMLFGFSTPGTSPASSGGGNCLSMSFQSVAMKKKPNNIAIAVHGGASDIVKMNLTPEQEKAYQDVLSAALDSGYTILEGGGTAEAAVVAAIVVLEDSPMFNAGKGSVFTKDSTIEMDAAIMDGNTLKCGSVAGVATVKNPIKAAKMVKDSSKFVFLSGAGADQFAKEHGLEIMPPEYFKTEFRRNQWLKTKNSDTVHLDNDGKGSYNPVDENKFNKYGTVGCVALDKDGNLCAGTSTGGVVNKKYNRIGDSPLIGAGTYAKNATCAVSCTGKGEDFIRLVVAHDISSLMEYKNYSLKHSVDEVIQHKLKDIGGRGGCIAIDGKGHIEMSFTTSGMFRGCIDVKKVKTVSIYGEKPAGK